MDEGGSDLDLIAVRGKICDVHLGHGGSVLLKIVPKISLTLADGR